jgi:Transcriptional Coactivator p15 (PC4)
MAGTNAKPGAGDTGPRQEISNALPAPNNRTTSEIQGAGFPVEIAKFWRNRRGEAVVLQLREYKGKRLFDVRQYFTAADGTFTPTQRGVSLVIGKLPEFVAAVAKAERKAVEMGLLETGGDDA